eukprot:SAG22_NODE_1276_length_4918_cov_1.532061_5_plen_55_part_00
MLHPDDSRQWLVVRAALLDRALAVRLEHAAEDPGIQRVREELATVTRKLGQPDE